jgi:hypothetical protein
LRQGRVPTPTSREQSARLQCARSFSSGM